MRRILAARAVYLTTPKTFYVIMEDTRLLNDVLEEIHRGYRIGDKADDIVGRSTLLFDGDISRNFEVSALVVFPSFRAFVAGPIKSKWMELH